MARFAFNRRFDEPPKLASPDTAAQEAARQEELWQERLATACAEAREEGHAAGFAEGRAEAQAASMLLAEQLKDRLSALFDAVDRQHEALERDATALALAAGEALAGAALQRLPHAGAEALIREALAEQFERPRLMLRLSPSDREPLEAFATSYALSMGYEGRLSFQTDPSLEPGDCIVEWADGGIGHRAATLRARVAALFEA